MAPRTHPQIDVIPTLIAEGVKAIIAARELAPALAPDEQLNRSLGATPTSDTIRRPIEKMITDWTALVALVESHTQAYVDALSSPTYTVDAMTRMWHERVVADQTTATGLLSSMHDTATSLRAAMVAVAWPTPANLAGIDRRQSMLTPVLDQIPDQFGLIDRLAAELERAYTAGDDTTVWLLTGDDFTRLYLEARGFADVHSSWKERALEIGASIASEDRRHALRVIDSIDSRTGALWTLLYVAKHAAGTISA